MSDTPPVIGQADALMRRHRRSFVAGGVTEATAPAGTVDDVPILTEVVNEQTSELASSQKEPETSQRLAEQIKLVLQRRSDLLEKELEAWIDAELPQSIAAALDQFSDQLMARLSAQVKTELLPQLLSVLKTGKGASAELASNPPRDEGVPPV